MDTQIAPPVGWSDDGRNAWGSAAQCLMHDSCTPSRYRSFTAQPTPARYVDDDPDELDDDDLEEWIDDAEPELVPVPVSVQPPAETGIPVDWPTRIVQPVPLPRR